MQGLKGNNKMNVKKMGERMKGKSVSAETVQKKLSKDYINKYISVKLKCSFYTLKKAR